MLTNKQAVILNYGQMNDDLSNNIKEHIDFIKRFFTQEPSLNSDPDLLLLNEKFRKFIIAFKDFSDGVEVVSEKVFIKENKS